VHLPLSRELLYTDITTRQQIAIQAFTRSTWIDTALTQLQKRTWDQISFIASLQQTSPPCEPLANQITSFVCEFDNQEHTFPDLCPKNDPASWLARRNLVYASVPDATTGNARDRVRIDDIRDNCFDTLNRAAGIDAEALILASLFPRLALLHVHFEPAGRSISRPFWTAIVAKAGGWRTQRHGLVHDSPQPAAVLIPALVQIAELRGFENPSSVTHPAIRMKMIALLVAVLCEKLGNEWELENDESLPKQGTPLGTDREAYEDLKLKKL
jgi:hypothetical protein